ncbi:GGDEF domain-containing protein [Pseudoalteromonas obscura]|uniref:diguanylate cyclase n=1 Tax=Pseudoalteromonas obscura TaxID=3048491 RepID=A0ABT7ERD9_9GAMM|nr:GGDEF domain-containing protein [Pseudoalteromonas sp. P94(2023)]MDK2597625.1 GGDEF domain-containing protein [Pseudoalteromonas sp. P94(2023)]
MDISPCGHDFAISLLQMRSENDLYKRVQQILAELLPNIPMAMYLAPSLSEKERLKLLTLSSAVSPPDLEYLLARAETLKHQHILRGENHLCIVLRNNKAVMGLLWIGEKLPTARSHLIAHLINVFYHQLNTLALSRIDPLTQLLNRQTFDDKVIEITTGEGFVIEREQQGVRKWYLALFDIDHFKIVNDDFGHVIGDEVLLLVAQQLKDNFRAEDFVFRYGGEEFAVLFQSHDRAEAKSLLDRVRKVIANFNFPQVQRLTISIGYTVLEEIAQVSELVHEADLALYHAKKHGRDQVVDFEELGIAGQAKADTDIELF